MTRPSLASAIAVHRRLLKSAELAADMQLTEIVIAILSAADESLDKLRGLARATFAEEHQE